MACICGTGGQDWSAACTRHGLSRGDWIQQALIADKAAADLRRENARLREGIEALVPKFAADYATTVLVDESGNDGWNMALESASVWLNQSVRALLAEGGE